MVLVKVISKPGAWAYTIPADPDPETGVPRRWSPGFVHHGTVFELRKPVNKPRKSPDEPAVWDGTYTTKLKPEEIDVCFEIVEQETKPSKVSKAQSELDMPSAKVG